MTLAEKAYRAIRRDIIQGSLPPNIRLRLTDLRDRYGIGFSPLREALNRLQSQNFVTLEPLKGYTVAELLLSELKDATNTRILLESEALQRAITLGGDDWESEIVSTLQALKLQVERPFNGDKIWEVENRHHAFHRALLSASDSRISMEFFECLYSKTERYRIPILQGRTDRTTAEVKAEHASIADAVLNRDIDQSIKLLSAHYKRTEKLISQYVQTEKCAWAGKRSS